jgi:hypothetical protein
MVLEHAQESGIFPTRLKKSMLIYSKRRFYIGS